ncbi:sulfotransferase family protein [Lacinutrix himadriensis]|uniref:sulfotransferase family protein n=1 Tax=Lacinutrix himadriensis TaxID=641549 RepID=UPI0006E122B5|nr:sulfotransferase [Lacinutrix himadriensis]
MAKNTQDVWKSKTPEHLPDFIIGGAMKSGTTSLHAILHSHPDIAMAHNELGFFDIDSILQHPDYNFYDPKKETWTSQSMQEQPTLLWNWYASQFKSIEKKAKIIGEDSTTYLTSEIAAKRIALQDKPIKLIFILRHPTKRTISNYLHLLKSGRAIYSLEDTLRYNPNSIIRRSMYPEQLEAYYKHIPFERIKVVLFEDLLEDKEKCIQEVCEFLEVDFSKLDTSVFNTHSNKTKTPKHIKLQLLRNRWLRKSGNYRYSSFLPLQPDFQGKMPLQYRIMDRLHKKLNPLKSTIKFKASKATVALLDDFFKTEFKDLDSLVKKEVFSKWFKN